MFRSLLTTILLTAAALAQPGMPPTSTLEGKDLGASQLDSIGAVLDPELTFRDELGRPFQFRQWFPGGQPVVLMLGYYRCPAMCGQVLEAAFRALSDVDFQPGRDYRVLSVSIDPRETPAEALARKENFLPKLARAGGDDAWRVLTGAEPEIRRLSELAGFRYYWAEAAQQFSHPPSLLFVTPKGQISRILVDTAFAPADVRLALVEASEGRLGSFLDQVRLNCLTFDARTNSYSMTAMTLMRIGGAVTLVVLAAMITVLLRRERQRHAPAVV